MTLTETLTCPVEPPGPVPAPVALIPVIDLRDGQVVRAVRGQRQHYQPLQTPLCDGSDPVTVAKALCTVTASPLLYVADLSALQGGAAQVEVWRDVLLALPTVRLWLDAGFTSLPQAHQLLAALGDVAARVDPVFASEALPDRAALQGCFAAEDPLGQRGILSLDRRDGLRLDAAGCWEAPECWPARVIVMTLERVGSGQGPDLSTLSGLRQRSPKTVWIGAGGVRDREDLVLAQQAGAQAWLVATALHEGRLP